MRISLLGTRSKLLSIGQYADDIALWDKCRGRQFSGKLTRATNGLVHCLADCLGFKVNAAKTQLMVLPNEWLIYHT